MRLCTGHTILLNHLQDSDSHMIQAKITLNPLYPYRKLYPLSISDYFINPGSRSNLVAHETYKIFAQKMMNQTHFQ